MINWLLCTFVGHNLTHIKSLRRSLVDVIKFGKKPIIRVFVCKRCGEEVVREGSI